MNVAWKGGGGGGPQQGFILESSAFSFRFENNIPAGKAKRKAVERMYENR